VTILTITLIAVVVTVIKIVIVDIRAYPNLFGGGGGDEKEAEAAGQTWAATSAPDLWGDLQ